MAAMKLSNLTFGYFELEWWNHRQIHMDVVCVFLVRHFYCCSNLTVDVVVMLIFRLNNSNIHSVEQDINYFHRSKLIDSEMKSDKRSSLISFSFIDRKAQFDGFCSIHLSSAFHSIFIQSSMKSQHSPKIAPLTYYSKNATNMC